MVRRDVSCWKTRLCKGNTNSRHSLYAIRTLMHVHGFNQTGCQFDGMRVRMIRVEGCVLKFIWILVSDHMDGAYYHLRVAEVEIYPGELSLKRFSHGH